MHATAYLLAGALVLRVASGQMGQGQGQQRWTTNWYAPIDQKPFPVFNPCLERVFVDVGPGGGTAANATWAPNHFLVDEAGDYWAVGLRYRGFNGSAPELRGDIVRYSVARNEWDCVHRDANDHPAADNPANRPGAIPWIVSRSALGGRLSVLCMAGGRAPLPKKAAQTQTSPQVPPSAAANGTDPVEEVVVEEQEELTYYSPAISDVLCAVLSANATVDNSGGRGLTWLPAAPLPFNATACTMVAVNSSAGAQWVLVGGARSDGSSELLVAALPPPARELLDRPSLYMPSGWVRLKLVAVSGSGPVNLQLRMRPVAAWMARSNWLLMGGGYSLPDGPMFRKILTEPTIPLSVIDFLTGLEARPIQMANDLFAVYLSPRIEALLAVGGGSTIPPPGTPNGGGGEGGSSNNSSSSSSSIGGSPGSVAIGYSVDTRRLIMTLPSSQQWNTAPTFASSASYSLFCLPSAVDGSDIYASAGQDRVGFYAGGSVYISTPPPGATGFGRSEHAFYGGASDQPTLQWWNGLRVYQTTPFTVAASSSYVSQWGESGNRPPLLNVPGGGGEGAGGGSTLSPSSAPQQRALQQQQEVGGGPVLQDPDSPPSLGSPPASSPAATAAAAAALPFAGIVALDPESGRVARGTLVGCISMDLFGQCDGNQFVSLCEKEPYDGHCAQCTVCQAGTEYTAYKCRHSGNAVCWPCEPCPNGTVQFLACGAPGNPSQTAPVCLPPLMISPTPAPTQLVDPGNGGDGSGGLALSPIFGPNQQIALAVVLCAEVLLGVALLIVEAINACRDRSVHSSAERGGGDWGSSSSSSSKGAAQQQQQQNGATGNSDHSSYYDSRVRTFAFILGHWLTSTMGLTLLLALALEAYVRSGSTRGYRFLGFCTLLSIFIGPMLWVASLLVRAGLTRSQPQLRLLLKKTVSGLPFAGLTAPLVFLRPQSLLGLNRVVVTGNAEHGGGSGSIFSCAPLSTWAAQDLRMLRIVSLLAILLSDIPLSALSLAYMLRGSGISSQAANAAASAGTPARNTGTNEINVILQALAQILQLWNLYSALTALSASHGRSAAGGGNVPLRSAGVAGGGKDLLPGGGGGGVGGSELGSTPYSPDESGLASSSSASASGGLGSLTSSLQPRLQLQAAAESSGSSSSGTNSNSNGKQGVMSVVRRHVNSLTFAVTTSSKQASGGGAAVPNPLAVAAMAAGSTSVLLQDQQQAVMMAPSSSSSSAVLPLSVGAARGSVNSGGRNRTASFVPVTASASTAAPTSGPGLRPSAAQQLPTMTSSSSAAAVSGAAVTSSSSSAGCEHNASRKCGKCVTAAVQGLRRYAATPEGRRLALRRAYFMTHPERLDEALVAVRQVPLPRPWFDLLCHLELLEDSPPGSAVGSASSGGGNGDHNSAGNALSGAVAAASSAAAAMGSAFHHDDSERDGASTARTEASTAQHQHHRFAAAAARDAHMTRDGAAAAAASHAVVVGSYQEDAGSLAASSILSSSPRESAVGSLLSSSGLSVDN